MADVTVPLQFLLGTNRILDGHRGIDPCQHIDIDVIGAQTAQAEGQALVVCGYLFDLVDKPN